MITIADLLRITITRTSILDELRVRSFEVIWIRISDPRSLGSWCTNGTDEPVTRVDSLVPLMNHDPSDLKSLIPIQITPKEGTLIVKLVIDDVRYINIPTWLRGFQDKLPHLVLFSFYPNLF